MKENVLPEGWEKTKLGKYLYLKNGYAFKKTDYVEKSKHSYPIIRISDINNFTATDKNAIHTNYIAKGFELEKNDLLIAMSGATTGKLGVYKGNIPAYQNQRVGNLKLIGKGDSQFRNYLMLSLQELIEKLAYGGAQPNISGKIIEDIDINLPPLPEQQYLSQKLTALLDEVAQTKQRLEAIPALLKQFRQSVLANAVSGRLTGFRKYQVYKLKDYFNFIDGDRGSNYPKKDEYLDKGYCLFLSTKNVREFGFDFSECVYISQEKDSVLRKGKLSRGDIIITTRGTLGNVASYDENISFDNVRINSGMLILRKKENNILNEYSKILIASPLFKKMIIDKQTGSAQPQLPAGILKEFEVPIPSIEEQTQIVQKVETYFALADEIEIQVNVALENVNLLTQSILAKAFSGELSATWRKKSSTYLNKE